jgi:hypothetical protein
MVRKVVGGDRLITLLRMACISGVDGRIPVGTCEADGGGDRRDFSPCTRAQWMEPARKVGNSCWQTEHVEGVWIFRVSCTHLA